VRGIQVIVPVTSTAASIPPAWPFPPPATPGQRQYRRTAQTSLRHRPRPARTASMCHRALLSAPTAHRRDAGIPGWRGFGGRAAGDL